MTHPAVLAAALTFAASVHCVGMCGGLVLAAAAPDAGRRLRLLGHHLLLQSGKAVSYAFLGALAGGLGAALLRQPLFGWSTRIVAAAAGAAIVLGGLSLLGLLGRRGGPEDGVLANLFGRTLGPLLASRPAGFPLVVGVVMGFLPCPLVYAGLGAAAATGSPAAGALVLAGVALGTVPALGTVALFGAAVPAGWRRGLARVAGVLLVGVGILNVYKGFAPARRAAPPAAVAAPASPAARQAPASSPAEVEPPPCPFHPAPTPAPSGAVPKSG